MFIDGAGLYKLESLKFMDYKRIVTLRDSFTSRVKHVMHLNPEIYKFKFSDQIKFKLTKTIHKIGSSSTILRTTLEDLTSGQLLADRYIKVVRSSLQRKPLEHPEWFTSKFRKYKETVAPKQLLKKSEIPPVPEDCFTLQTKIRYSDIDWNGHTNVAVYFKICIDCAFAAVSENKLVGFNGDFNSNTVVYTQSDYIGESFAGDDLIVKCWQDVMNKYCLKFLIFKKEDVINYSIMKLTEEGKSKL